MLKHNDIRMSAETISAYADILSLNYGDVNYKYNLQGPALNYDDMCAVGKEIVRRDIVAAIEAFDTTPAIKKFMLDRADKRGAQKPQKYDASHFAAAAKRTVNQYGKKREAYKPVGKCELKMKLKEAVRFGYRQEAYADHSETLIPVEGDISKADINACQQNIGNFFRYADSHTGMAGSGCNYSASLIVTELGAFIQVNCRASIMD